MSDRPLQQQTQRVYLPIYESAEFKPSAGGSGAARYTFEQSYTNGWPAANVTQANVQPMDWNYTVRPGSSESWASAGSGIVTPRILTAAAGSTSDTLSCICNVPITQLYDVYVGAWYDSTTAKIFIIQYRPLSDSATLIGSFTVCTNADQVFITEISNGAALTPGIAVSYLKGDRVTCHGAYALTTGGVFTAASLTSLDATAGFPITLGKVITGPFQFMNGHSYIMTIDGFIYESQFTTLNPDITAWNSLSTVAASQYPDRGLGVYRYKDLLISVGQDSMEFWSSSNNNPPASALVRVDQAFIKFGAISPKLVATYNDIMYWVAYGSSDTTGVWMMEGYNPKKISTDREDYMLMRTYNTTALAYPSNCYSMEMVLIGDKQHLLLNGIFNNPLCYHLEQKMWWNMNLGNVVAIFPATAFGSATVSAYPASTYVQYFFGRVGTDAGQSNLINGAGGAVGSIANGSTRTYTFNIASSAFMNLDLQTVVSAVPCYQGIFWRIVFNTKWFNTAAKKRINRLEVMSDGFTDAVTLGYVRDGVNTTPVIRTMDGGTTGRHYCNNLGTGRSIHYSLQGTTIAGSDQIRIRGLDMSLALGTH